jgi:hypothetical protein
MVQLHNGTSVKEEISRALTRQSLGAAGNAAPPGRVVPLEQVRLQINFTQTENWMLLENLGYAEEADAGIAMGETACE